MRHTTVAGLALAALLAAPAPAGAKGTVAMSVCGANGCHRVERVAVRDGVDAYARAAAPRDAEPFFGVRARAHVSSGRVVEVFAPTRKNAHDGPGGTAIAGALALAALLGLTLARRR